MMYFIKNWRVKFDVLTEVKIPTIFHEYKYLNLFVDIGPEEQQIHFLFK